MRKRASTTHCIISFHSYNKKKDDAFYDTCHSSCEQIKSNFQEICHRVARPFYLLQTFANISALPNKEAPLLPFLGTPCKSVTADLWWLGVEHQSALARGQGFRTHSHGRRVWLRSSSVISKVCFCGIFLTVTMQAPPGGVDPHKYYRKKREVPGKGGKQ